MLASSGNLNTVDDSVTVRKDWRVQLRPIYSNRVLDVLPVYKLNTHAPFFVPENDQDITSNMSIFKRCFRDPVFALHHRVVRLTGARPHSVPGFHHLAKRVRV